MSDAEKKIVHDQWPKVKAAAGGLDAVGLKVFEKFLTDNPAMIPKFSYAAGCANINELKSKNMKGLQDHATLIITQIDMAINSMGDAAAIAELKALGTRHKNYNVAAADFPLLGVSMMAVLKQALGADLNEAAWQKAYDGITSHIVTAMTA